MGQVSSTSRDQRQDSRPRSYLSSRNQNGESNTTNNIVMADQTGRHGSFIHAQPAHSHGDHQSQISLPPISSQLDQTDGGPDLSRRGSNTSLPSISQLLNSHPSGPGEQSATPAPISHIGLRRQSAMSRLGSRILPNAVIRGLLNSEEETPAEGRAHRNGRLSRSLRRTESTQNNRFSPFNSLGSRNAARRRSTRGTVALPPLPRSDSALVSDPSSVYLGSSTDAAESSNRLSWRRSPRLNPARNSLPFPTPQIFDSTNQDASQISNTSPSDHFNSSTFGRSADSFLPPLSPIDTSMDLGEVSQTATSLEPEQTTPWPAPPIASSARNAPGARTIRRLPGVLRARSSRVLRRDEQTPLSRVLQLAAAAIAAQLAGSEGLGLLNPPAAGNNEGLDGSLETFIQNLQQATSLQGNTSGAGDSERPSTDGQPQPVSFLRVFRFANAPGQAGSAPLQPPITPSREQNNNSNNASDRMGVEDQGEEGAEERTVTLVVVGVRSVPTTNGMTGAQTAAPLGLDGFLGLPVNPAGNSNEFGIGGGGNLLRRSDGRSRLTSQRGAMGTASPLASTIDGQRPQRLSPGPRPQSDATLPPSGLSSTLPTVLSESPPGPHPPPSTPAVSSGTTTPSRRPSSASAIYPGGLPQLQEDHASVVDPMETEPSFTSARQRRRSESEAARHRHLGSGAARRNGVVEPDNPGTPVGRTWLIYVVGTNLSENHPAFATPSLFTDNPTYEDMILLSSLLGPVKPPVASEADIMSAGGLFRLSEYAGSLVAESLDGNQPIQLAESERCLICLSDYEAAEEVRQLNSCQHLFHKTCIDQWLTTGRNSCPLCRSQGVSESSRTSNPPSTEEAVA